MKALHSIQSYPGGKLPTLEGFADPLSGSLDNYKRGYYEYDVQLRSSGPAETAVQVTAKITAYYAGSAGTPGYQVLKSSGRLESDLLDSLNEKLNPGVTANRSNAASTAAKSLPDSPSATIVSPYFNTPRLATAPSGTKPPTPTANLDPASAKRLHDLEGQAQNLEEILHNQVHPDNLAVVKRSNTPVVAQPLDGSEVLFQADAEDEFEVLDTTEDWVHIKISGISRGWIKREHVDLPGAATVSIATIAAAPKEDAVRQTKEEVAQFPGQWDQLNGKQVKIIWIQPLDKDQFGSSPKWSLAKAVFRKADTGAPGDNTTDIAGVVIIFDSEDGGMAATTMANLQQWRAGHLSDETFSRRCWRDPAAAFQAQN